MTTTTKTAATTAWTTIVEAEQACEKAQEWLKNLEQKQQELDQLAEETLAKYPLL